MNKQPQIDQQITFLYATDLLETIAFYEDIMGFELVLDQKTCRIYRISPTAFLGICNLPMYLLRYPKGHLLEQDLAGLFWQYGMLVL